MVAAVVAPPWASLGPDKMCMLRWICGHIKKIESKTMINVIG
jgi:hypothetical protein